MISTFLGGAIGAVLAAAGPVGAAVTGAWVRSSLPPTAAVASVIARSSAWRPMSSDPTTRATRSAAAPLIVTRLSGTRPRRMGSSRR
jgi:hypothetical protein